MNMTELRTWKQYQAHYKKFLKNQVSMTHDKVDKLDKELRKLFKEKEKHFKHECELSYLITDLEEAPEWNKKIIRRVDTVFRQAVVKAVRKVRDERCG